MQVQTISLPGAGDVTLTVYLPQQSKEMPNMKNRPSVLVIPGGGYRMCSDREAEPVALGFMQYGYAAYVLRYSVQQAAQWPNPLRDAECAMKTIREHAAEWDIDPERIAAIGFSAGGHLAAALATLGNCRPNALILGYPCTLDDMDCVQEFGAPVLDTAVSAQTPPTFIFAATDDNIVPIRHSLRFASALDAAGVPFEMHLYARGQHGFSLATPFVCAEESWLHMCEGCSDWMPRCAAWLDSYFHIGR